mmetsp:Transcript_33725/g.62379  ORF Transcript_33725/g.62379 Transcript_33725/m.62379 type:complete len:1515 (-) Transcript_33725:86-4630(-)
MATFADKIIFPSPTPTYSKDHFKKHLCWVPWNAAVSPDRVDDEKYADGIPCMWLPAPKAAGVILFCHGNAEDLGMSFAFVRHMRDQFKMNVLAVEYPGYGLLSHIPASEAALKEVVLTAFRFILDELKVQYEHIILFGRSIGSGPAIFLASRFPVGGLILVAAFASVNQVIRSLVGGLIAKAFLERFPNISLIGNVSCPTLFIHGEKDNLVPPSQSVALFKQCRARKLLITPPSMEHNTNLFSDASFLAVPAINFFGLPGYQQDTPPQMPHRFFEDGRQAFLLRKASKRKNGQEKEKEKDKENEKVKDKEKKDKKDKKEKKEKKDKKDGKEETKAPEVAKEPEPATKAPEPEDEEDGIAAAFAMFDLPEDEIVKEAAQEEETKKPEEEQAEDDAMDFWAQLGEMQEEEEPDEQEEALVPASSAVKATGDAGVFQVPPEAAEELRRKMDRIVEMTGAFLEMRQHTSGTHILKLSGDSGTADASRYARAIVERRLDLESHSDFTSVSVPQEWLEKWWGREEKIEADLGVLILSESRRSKRDRVTRWRPNQIVEACYSNSRWYTACVIETSKGGKVNIRWIFDGSIEEVEASKVRVQLRVGIFGKPRDRLKAEVKILEAVEAEVAGTIAVHLERRGHGEGLSLQPVPLQCRQNDFERKKSMVAPMMPLLKNACGSADISFFRRPAKNRWMDMSYAMLAGTREERWFAGQVLASFIVSLVQRNTGGEAGKQMKTGMDSVPPHLMGEMRLVKIPAKCMGRVIGKGASNLRQLMEETKTFMYALKEVQGKTMRTTNIEEAMQTLKNNMRSGDYTPMCIFGQNRARFAAELKLMAVIEETLPGYWETAEGQTEQLSKVDGLDVDKFWLPGDFEPDANSIQVKILSAAAGCLAASAGRLVLIGGVKAERERGREYMRWMSNKRLERVHPKIYDLASRRDLVTIDVSREVIKSKWFNTEITKLSQEIGIATFFTECETSDGSGKLVLAGLQVTKRDANMSDIMQDYQDLCDRTQAWAEGREWSGKADRRWNRESRLKESKGKESKEWKSGSGSDQSWSNQGWQDNWGSGSWNSSQWEVNPGAAPPATPAFGVKPPATPAIGVRPPATPAIGVAPPATPAFGVAPPATPAFGVRPPATPAFGAAPPATPAYGVKPPATPAWGVAPPATPAVGVAPPATPMPGSFGPHGGRQPATPGMPGVAPPATPGGFAPPATPGGFGPHGQSSPTTPGMLGAGARPPQTPAVGVAPPQTPGVAGVRPPQTPAVGGFGVKPPQTPAVGVKPPQTPGFAQHVPAPSTPAGLTAPRSVPAPSTPAGLSTPRPESTGSKRGIPMPATPGNLGNDLPPEKRQRLGTSRADMLAAQAQEELRQIRERKQGGPSAPAGSTASRLAEQPNSCSSCGFEFEHDDSAEFCKQCGKKRFVPQTAPKRRKCEPLKEPAVKTESGLLRAPPSHWRKQTGTARAAGRSAGIPASPGNATVPSTPARPGGLTVPATPARPPSGGSSDAPTLRSSTHAPATPPELRPY